MGEKSQRPLCVNSNLFNANAFDFPYEELVKFAGKQIAWNLEGTKILASGEDYPQLFQALDEQGIKISQVVLDCVPTNEEQA